MQEILTFTPEQTEKLERFALCNKACQDGMKFLKEGHKEVGFYDKDGKLGLVADEQIVRAIGFGADRIYDNLSNPPVVKNGRFVIVNGKTLKNKDNDMKRICKGIMEIHKRA